MCLEAELTEQFDLRSVFFQHRELDALTNQEAANHLTKATKACENNWMLFCDRVVFGFGKIAHETRHDEMVETQHYKRRCCDR